MKMIFGYIWGLWWWRTSSPDTCVTDTLCCLHSLSGCRSEMGVLDAAGLKDMVSLGRDRGIPKSVAADILTTKRVGHESSRRCKRHQWKGVMPNGSLCQVGDGRYVFSPAMCLLQISGIIAREYGDELPAKFHVVIVAELACEICGQYSLTEKDGFALRSPLVGLDELAVLALGATGTYGAGLLRQALPYVIENLRSPKETDVFLLLCLPCEKGGFDLPRPLSNHDLDVNGVTAGFLAGWATCNVDFYWPQARLIVEYDSQTYHADDHKAQRDRERADALRALGYVVVSITHDDLYSDKRFRAKAEEIAQTLHEQLPEETEAFTEANKALRAMLLRHDRWI